MKSCLMRQTCMYQWFKRAVRHMTYSPVMNVTVTLHLKTVPYLYHKDLLLLFAVSQRLLKDH